MNLPKNATVAVADGQKLNLFRNEGDEAATKLVAVEHSNVDDIKGSETGRHGSSANPDGGQDDEDGFSAGVAKLLNTEVLGGKITALVVVAAPRTLGALRKHYHAKLSEVLYGEIAKQLTGHGISDIEKAVSAA